MNNRTGHLYSERGKRVAFVRETVEGRWALTIFHGEVEEVDDPDNQWQARAGHFSTLENAVKTVEIAIGGPVELDGPAVDAEPL